MNKQLIKFSVIIGFIVTFAVTGNAKSVSRSEFEIPFDFIIKDRIFPAGKYSVEHLNQVNSNFLILKKVGGNEKTIFLIQSASTNKLKNQMQLIFNRTDKKYVLNEIWAFGERYGQRISTDESEKMLQAA